jgi:hypothetical protein
MKELMDVDMHMVVKSLVFSPIDNILVAGCETSSRSGMIISFKIEKDIPAHATSDGWTMTRFTKERSTISAISTLASSMEMLNLIIYLMKVAPTTPLQT